MELRSWGSVKSHSKASEDRPGKGNWRRDLGVREWGSAAIGSTGMMTWSTPSRPWPADAGLVLLIVALRARLRTTVSRPPPQPESAFLSSAK